MTYVEKIYAIASVTVFVAAIQKKITHGDVNSYSDYLTCVTDVIMDLCNTKPVKENITAIKYVKKFANSMASDDLKGELCVCILMNKYMDMLDEICESEEETTTGEGAEA